MRIGVALVCSATLATGIAAQPPNWLLQNLTTAPGARNRHAMAFDAARQEVVLFGGNDGTLLGDTWIWTGTNWIHRQPATSPSPRVDHAMAYDALRQRVVLWGGNTLDTSVWEWDGLDWHAVASFGPIVRPGHAMAYDDTRQRVVMFGGGVFGAADTWEWDGVNWTPRVSAHYPSPRSGHAMTHDPVRHRLVMFAGQLGGLANQETWEWDGSDWTLAASNGPAPRTWHTMVWSPTLQRVVLFGGAQGISVGNALADTWTWDGVAWTQLVTTSTPSPRSSAAASFHQGYGLVLFGGLATGPSVPPTWNAQTFLFGGAVASATTYGASCGTPLLTLAPVANQRPLLGQVARALVTNAPGAATLIAAGSSAGHLGPFVLPLPLSGFGLTGCWLAHSAESLGLPVVPVTGGYEFAAAIPNSVGLLGATVHLQAYALAPGQNPAGITASNGLTWRCGDL